MVFEEVTMMAGFIAGMIVTAIVFRIAGAVGYLKGRLDEHLRQHREFEEMAQGSRGTESEDVGA